MTRRVCASLFALFLVVAMVGPMQVCAQGIELQSHAGVLMDATSGEVLFAKNPHTPLPPASVTKLMTLFLTFEALENGTIAPEDNVQVSSYAAGLGGAQVYLETGEVISLEELLKSVAIRSANDAAAALAEHVAGTHEQFVVLMNEKARVLGMKNTHFTNPHGLYDEEHLMSALDVAILSRELIMRFPKVLEYTKRWDDRIRVGTEDEQWLVNTNKLIQRYEGIDGLKTGWTGSESGWCVSATAQRDGTRFIAVIMKGPSSDVRFEEAMKLLNYGFANFESVKVADANTAQGKVVVDEGVEREVDAVLTKPMGATVRKGQASKLQKTIRLDDYVTAPVEAGQRVGEIIVTLDGEPVAQGELVAAKTVARISWLRLMIRNIRHSWPLFGP